MINDKEWVKKEDLEGKHLASELNLGGHWTELPIGSHTLRGRSGWAIIAHVKLERAVEKMNVGQ